MSIFGFYFTGELLREAGWPRKQGLFKKDVVNTMTLDAVIEQMINWAAAIGAGRPKLALQVIAEMFRDRDWSDDTAPDIKKFIDSARASIEGYSGYETVAPNEIVKVSKFEKTGKTIPLKELTDKRMSAILEHWTLEAMLWGFANPLRFDMV